MCAVQLCAVTLDASCLPPFIPPTPGATMITQRCDYVVSGDFGLVG